MSVVASVVLAPGLAACGQKGALIAVPPVRGAASAASATSVTAPSTAPLPPPEPLTPGSPGTAPR